MKRFTLGSLIAAGAITIGALLVAAPAAQAGTPSNADQDVCKALSGDFTQSD
jgi:hypothetical protein